MTTLVVCSGLVEDLNDLKNYLVSNNIPVYYVEAFNDLNIINIYLTVSYDPSTIQTFVSQYNTVIVLYNKYPTIISGTITIDDLTQVNTKIYGISIISINPLTRSSASSTFIVSKNIASKLPSLVKLNGYTTSLTPVWEAGNILELSGGLNKTYDISDRTNDYTTIVNLESTTQSLISSRLQGCEMFIIENENSGPVGSFIISKNNVTLFPSIMRLTSSNPVVSAKLNITWNPSEGINLSKSTNEYNGNYNITRMNNSTIFQEYFTLSGETEVEITTSIIRISGFIIIENTMDNGPCAIFSITKHNFVYNANVSKIGGCNGVNTHEKLNVTWDAYGKIIVSKTGNNYNGSYRILVIN